MAVIKITQELKLADCGVTANEDGTFDGVGKEVYILSFDTADTPGSRPYIARDYVTAVGGVRVPALWESHPYDPYIYVRNKTVKMWNGPLHWAVTVEYQYLQNPLLEPYVAEWFFSTSNEPIDRDRLDAPITNSADEPFDPPIQEEAHDLILRITRNEASYSPLVAMEYKKSINNDTFLWFPPKTVKTTVFEGRRIRVANLYFVKVNYEFQVRLDTDKDDNVIGWKRRLRDQGLRTKTAGKYSLIVGEDGNPVTSPVPLDGLGQVLAAGNPAVFLTYETKQLLNYTPLGFSTTDPSFYTGYIS